MYLKFLFNIKCPQASRHSGLVSVSNKRSLLERARNKFGMTSRGFTFKLRYGFTLAEVLITLGIIGVVAALTIPTLVNNYQKTQYITGFKKAFASFNQVLISYANDQGCTGDLSCTGVFDTGKTNADLGNALVTYFKVIKNCDTQNNQNCFINPTTDHYDGTSGVAQDLGAAYKFIAVDGVSYALLNFADGCSNMSTGRTGHLKQSCAMIYIDINGPSKKPNLVGRDIFNLYISNGKGPSLYPRGGSDDNFAGSDWWWDNGANGCSPSQVLAWYCSGRVIEKGWVMDY